MAGWRDIEARLDRAEVRTFGERTQNEALAALGAQIVRSNPSPLPKDTPQMNRVLHALFTKPVPEVPPLSPTADTALPRLQVWLRNHLAAALFGAIMVRLEPWQPGAAPLRFPAD